MNPKARRTQQTSQVHCHQSGNKKGQSKETRQGGQGKELAPLNSRLIHLPAHLWKQPLKIRRKEELQIASSKARLFASRLTGKRVEIRAEQANAAGL